MSMIQNKTLKIKNKYETLKEIVKQKSLWFQAKKVRYVPSLSFISLFAGIALSQWGIPGGAGGLKGAYLATGVMVSLSTLILVITEKKSITAKHILNAVKSFNGKGFKDYLFDYVNRVDNITDKSESFELRKGMIANDNNKRVLLSVENTMYDLTYEVGNLMSREIFEYIYAQCQLHFDRNQSFLSNLQTILANFQSFQSNETSQDIHYYRLSQMMSRTEVSTYLSLLENIQGNEIDMVEFICYLYIQTNTSEMFTMRNRMNTFLTERTQTVIEDRIAENNVIVSDEVEDNQLSNELLSLKGINDSLKDSRVEYNESVKNNTLNEFIEKL